MSAEAITTRILTEIDRDYYDVVIINYANADMVGHTGMLPAAIEAIKTVDNCLKAVVKKVRQKEGVLLITADHGKAETMVCPTTGSPFTAHTCNKVPFILVSELHKGKQLRENSSLRDVAPTMLDLLGIEKPKEMTGISLIQL
jgi:2,3-bisphosphoglycerate-independent phosphoglycerate mutase